MGALTGFAGSAVGSLAGGVFSNSSNATRIIDTTLSGGISGGIASKINGGNFWDGFRNGVLSAGLNHAAHQLQVVDADKLKQRILKDGKLTLREANKWFRRGNGLSLTVDASQIDLDFINPDSFEVGVKKGVQTLLNSKDGLVYGKLAILKHQNNKFSILPDLYDFIMESGGFSFRNFATRIGSWVAGNGTPFTINFAGYNVPKPKIFR